MLKKKEGASVLV